MNTNAKHELGPLSAHKANGPSGPCMAIVDDYSGNVVAHTFPEIFHAHTQRDNAARIVECVNACRRINPAAVPGLLTALKSAVSYLEANRPKGKIREIFTQLNEYENGVLKPARAAIALAEGGAQ